ncbi:MAG: Na+/H+ antiporter NhaC family protein [Lachnospiraceae bacterium]|nr:Na+/H+ antiporter NhaC family protein [Lachnospiraceae bacterium]
MKDGKKYEVVFRGSQLLAFIPMIIFLAFCVIFFVIFKVFDMNVLAVGGFLGLLIGALFAKTYDKYWGAVLNGIGSSTSVSIVVILLVIGMFTKLMAVSGVSQGFIWLAYKLGMSGGIFTGFTFLASCLITTATGSSIGTLSTVFPILFPAGVLMGGNPAILAGAILSGAIFGDNLAPISDVTIASTTNQRFRKKEGNADIAGTVSYRLKYALISGACSLILFVVIGGNGTAQNGAEDILQNNMNPRGLIMLIPVFLLLLVSIKTQDIFKAVTTGLISGIIIGLLSGAFEPAAILSIADGNATGFIYTGFTGMIGICLFCIALFGAMGVLEESGTMNKMIQGICNSTFAKTVRGAELLIAVGSMFTTVLVGGVTSASVLTFGPIADELGAKHNIHPYRRANILSGFANSFPAILPFISAFIFISVSVIEPLIEESSYLTPVSPMQIFSGAFYPMILFVVLMISILTGWDRIYEGSGGSIAKVDK